MGKPGKEKDKWCWEFSWGGGAAADLEGCTHLEMVCCWPQQKPMCECIGHKFLFYLVALKRAVLFCGGLFYWFSSAPMTFTSKS